MAAPQPYGPDGAPVVSDSVDPFQPVMFRAPGINTFAILSLVLAICGAGVFGLPFGIVALRQIKRTGQWGRGLAIAGVAISAVSLVAIIVAGGIILATSAHRSDSGQIDTPGIVAIAELRQWDCIEKVPQGRATDVTALPCSQRHEAEVFEVFPLPDSGYPGDSAVQTLANIGCSAKLKAYSPLAARDETIAIYYFLPNEQTWKQGDRSVVCLAVHPDHPQSGSIRD